MATATVWLNAQESARGDIKTAIERNQQQPYERIYPPQATESNLSNATMGLVEQAWIDYYRLLSAIHGDSPTSKQATELSSLIRSLGIPPQQVDDDKIKVGKVMLRRKRLDRKSELLKQRTESQKAHSENLKLQAAAQREWDKRIFKTGGRLDKVEQILSVVFQAEQEMRAVEEHEPLLHRAIMGLDLILWT